MGLAQQLQAVESILHLAKRTLIQDHMEHCIADALNEGGMTAKASVVRVQIAVQIPLRPAMLPDTITTPGLLLVLSVAVVGVLHTAVPDHWVPITLIARQRGWSRAETRRQRWWRARGTSSPL
jgi:hypothetical protein